MRLNITESLRNAFHFLTPKEADQIQGFLHPAPSHIGETKCAHSKYISIKEEARQPGFWTVEILAYAERTPLMMGEFPSPYNYTPSLYAPDGLLTMKPVSTLELIRLLDKTYANTECEYSYRSDLKQKLQRAVVVQSNDPSPKFAQ